MGVVSKLVEDQEEVLNDSWTLNKIKAQVDLGKLKVD